MQARPFALARLLGVSVTLLIVLGMGHTIYAATVNWVTLGFNESLFTPNGDSQTLTDSLGDGIHMELSVTPVVLNRLDSIIPDAGNGNERLNIRSRRKRSQVRAQFHR